MDDDYCKALAGYSIAESAHEDFRRSGDGYAYCPYCGELLKRRS